MDDITMGTHPVNLALRFLLEMVALVALGLWGWQRGDGLLRFVLAVGIPLAAAAAWGIFNVPDDPSRSGGAPVPVPGILRLALELAFFALATLALYDSGFRTLSWVMGVMVALHYLASYDRIRWLLSQ
jgi:hypothetical protein